MYLLSENERWQTERHRREINIDQLPTELDDVDRNISSGHHVTIPPTLTTPSSQMCTSAHFRRAYQEFQHIYRLPVTGMCDNTTKAFMSQRRCGQPDIFNVDEMMSYGYTHSPDTQTNNLAESMDSGEATIFEDDSPSSEDTAMEDKRRKRRSILDLIMPVRTVRDILDTRDIREIQLQEILETQPDNHKTYKEGQSTRRKRSMYTFIINDHTDIIGKLELTWRLMSAHTSPHMPVAKQNSILAHAFRYWSEVSPLCFKEDKHSPRVDIEIGFLEGNTKV